MGRAGKEQAGLEKDMEEFGVVWGQNSREGSTAGKANVKGGAGWPAWPGQGHAHPQSPTCSPDIQVIHIYLAVWHKTVPLLPDPGTRC